MSRAVLLAALLLLALTGCGADEDARSALADTAANLGEIRGGTLDVGLLVEPREGEPFGFELAGPFRLRGEGELPVMRVDYTRIADGRRATVTLVSDGREVHAETDGGRVELTPAQADELRSAAGSLGAGAGTLDIADWIASADVSDGGAIGGAETDKVEGDLDVVATVNGLGRLAGMQAVAGAEAERLREATESARYVLHTGKEDRLLRRLEMTVDFGFDVPDELRSGLGDVAGAKVTFRLGVLDPERR